MKNPICVTLLIVSSFWEICQSENYESGKSNKNIDGDKQDRKTRSLLNLASGRINPLDEIPSDYTGEIGEPQSSNFNFGFDEGNPDIHGDIQRPCQAYDTFCIRQFFADHSRCQVSGRLLPDPLVRDEESVYFSRNNMTGSSVPAHYRGLNNARVSEFYINNLTDNLVIAITFDNAEKIFDRVYFKYHLRGREPIVIRGSGNIRYGVVTVTVIIPRIENLRLDRSEIYTYGDTDLIAFLIGPEIGVSSDPEVVAMHASFYENIPDEYMEELTTQGYFIVANYIQYNICDFGLRIA